jgi:hypothetical protein
MQPRYRTMTIAFPVSTASTVVDLIDAEIAKVEKKANALSERARVSARARSQRRVYDLKLSDLREARAALAVAAQAHLDAIVGKVLPDVESDSCAA